MKKLIILAVMASFGSLQLSAQTKPEKTKNKMNKEIPKISDFPTGEENTGFAKYFTGKSYLAPLTNNKNLNVPLANVTFEPGCRNNWHSHTGGQLLIVVGGEGLYQERGKAARHLKVGDVVEIAPNVEHWHGATASSWFAHLATNGNPATNENNWLEAVSDEEYKIANDQNPKK
ncbi:cupin domain-containing protein [Pedobacter mucosus]|uniref:cupin domain-containing protein n=1 Tax=Pedobacter mucosus TaxID=2895286 RepID=UPI001EE45FFA|nr:cupin domain-containing protein [Pedobacter mucosus]UKT64701.1 cupin domain-containing protein [Pedobacter mucosus]